MMRPTAFTGGDRKVDRWSRDSEAGRLLKHLIENGDIDPSDPPKQIWDNYPIFKQYELAKFRAALNKLKSDLGCNIRTKKGDSNDEEGGYAGGGGYAGVGGGYADGNEVLCVCEERGWMPIHTVYKWCDSCLRDQLSVVVVLPIGIDSKYTLAVVGGGTKLEIIVEWPEMLVDAEKLHEPFTKIMELKKGTGIADGSVQDYITKMQQYKLHINGIGRKMDRYESKATIDLPRTVHAHNIETNAIGRKEGSRFLYINLLCECTDSNKQRGGDFFII